MVVPTPSPLPLLLSAIDSNSKNGKGEIKMFCTFEDFDRIDANIKSWFHDEMLGRNFTTKTSRHFRHAAHVHEFPFSSKGRDGVGISRPHPIQEEAEQDLTIIFFNKFLGGDPKHPFLCIYKGGDPEQKLVFYLPKTLKQERASKPGENWDDLHAAGTDHIDWYTCLLKLQGDDLIPVNPTFSCLCKEPNYQKPFFVRRLYNAIVNELKAIREPMEGAKQEVDEDEGAETDAMEE